MARPQYKSKAERQRRYRQRVARGLAIYKVELAQKDMESLIALRGLTDEEARSTAHLEKEVSAMLREYLSLLKKTVTRNA